ncbi:hypothetical protein [Variovorax sp. ZT4R33]|uniref:hypothetical protein n=1 Tax=Variovorax sp. ZT4R33 TaxID=3443743 RepID=UPI003F47CA8F
MPESILLEVLAKLGGYAALIILVLTAAWQAFKHLTSKWLENRFAEKLKKIEQQHDMALRHLQSSIDRELDRARKLNAQEFDTLDEGWAILHDAYWRTRDATGRGRRDYQFEAMSEGQAAQFIESSELEEWQKQEIHVINEAAERTAYYRKAMGWLTLSKCKDSRQKLVMFVDRKAIFMLPEIRALFDRLEIMVRDALTELSTRLEMPDDARREFSRHEVLAHDGESLYRDLEARIRDRLWSAAAVDTLPVRDVASAER